MIRELDADIMALQELERVPLSFTSPQLCDFIVNFLIPRFVSAVG